MKCYIRRFKNGEFGQGYFRLNICKGINHWVFRLEEAKLFNSVKDARKAIKKYGIKNCEVEYESKTNDKSRSRNTRFTKQTKTRT